MENMNDTEYKGKGFIDTEIPLIACENPGDQDWQLEKTKHYCPDFKPDIHFIYGGFYGKQYSWLRMAVHQCDNSTKAEEQRNITGKTHIKCATEDEQKAYFERTIIGLDASAFEPNIDEDFSKYLNSNDLEKKVTQDSLI